MKVSCFSEGVCFPYLRNYFQYFSNHTIIDKEVLELIFSEPNFDPKIGAVELKNFSTSRVKTLLKVFKTSYEQCIHIMAKFDKRFFLGKRKY